ncbi:hypothetical protein [Paenarthrobacter sp. NPDC090522]|uniref:hypothetical protein n=1 Tax=Paenarthrobacter sp. NPDC090522 TaxID=3364383 RepID=UPI0038148F58
MSEPIDVGPEGRRSISDMVRNIMDTRQLSRSEMADFLGRSPRMIGKLLSGESKGESFRGALEELDTQGTVTRQPERRRAKDGHVVPVRAKETPDAPRRVDPKTGRELAPVKTPEPERVGRYTDKIPEKYRNRKWANKNGDKHMRVAMPPGDDKATETGMAALKRQAQSIARSQAHKNKRIKIDVTLDNGRQMSIFGKGGENASNLLRRINKDFGGDVDAYIRDQVGKTYPPGGPGGHRFAAVSLTTFDAKTPKKK